MTLSNVTGRVTVRDLQELQRPGLSWYAQMGGLTVGFILLIAAPHLVTTWAVRGIQAYNSIPVMPDIAVSDALTASALADAALADAELGDSSAAVDDAKVMAFLDLIAWAEGTGDRYDYIYTHATFTGNEHPRQIKCSNGLCSDAAGRYQFLSTTWERLGLPDFSPANQDKGAIALLKQSGAYDLILAGDIEGAVCKAGPVWASLPCNDYNQPQKSKEALKSKYAEFLAKRSAASKPASSAWIHPVPGATLTSKFGWRDHADKRFRMCHYGLDFAGPIGMPILAAKAGKVVAASDVGDGLGNKVMLEHPDGTKSIYGHNSDLLVKVGDSVQQGQAIARMGNTGNSSGPHLHFEVTDTSGTVIDPEPLIPGIVGAQTFGEIDPVKSAQCVDKRV